MFSFFLRFVFQDLSLCISGPYSEALAFRAHYVGPSFSETVMALVLYIS